MNPWILAWETRWIMGPFTWMGNIPRGIKHEFCFGHFRLWCLLHIKRQVSTLRYKSWAQRAYLSITQNIRRCHEKKIPIHSLEISWSKHSSFMFWDNTLGEELRKEDHHPRKCANPRKPNYLSLIITRYDKCKWCWVNFSSSNGVWEPL